MPLPENNILFYWTAPKGETFVISRNDWIVGKINHNWRNKRWTSTFIIRKMGFDMNCKGTTGVIY